MKIELFRGDRSIGEVTLLDGEVDPGAIVDLSEREAVAQVFEEYGDKAMTFAWAGFGGQLEPFRHEPSTKG
jgi:hypothetical protein